jgi:hypothetical protein
MFGILLSALNAILGTVFKQVFQVLVVKFVLYTVLFLVATAFISLIQTSGLLPTIGQINQGLSMIPPGMGYFMDMFAFNYGLGIVLSAYATRFIIRRIPFFN